MLASNTAGQVCGEDPGWERPEFAIEVVKFGATEVMEVERLLPSQHHFNNGYSKFEHLHPAGRQNASKSSKSSGF
jgi:hypothetical protein